MLVNILDHDMAFLAFCLRYLVFGLPRDVWSWVNVYGKLSRQAWSSYIKCGSLLTCVFEGPLTLSHSLCLQVVLPAFWLFDPLGHSHVGCIHHHTNRVTWNEVLKNLKSSKNQTFQDPKHNLSKLGFTPHIIFRGEKIYLPKLCPPHVPI